MTNSNKILTNIFIINIVHKVQTNVQSKNNEK